MPRFVHPGTTALVAVGASNHATAATQQQMAAQQQAMQSTYYTNGPKYPVTSYPFYK